MSSLPKFQHEWQQQFGFLQVRHRHDATRPSALQYLEIAFSANADGKLLLQAARERLIADGIEKNKLRPRELHIDGVVDEYLLVIVGGENIARFQELYGEGISIARDA